MRSLILTSLAFLAGCCLSIEEFEQQAADATACSSGDTCVLAGSAQCLCARPVNASKAAELDATAGDVCCAGTLADCVAFRNLRCENGRCVGDTL